MSNTNKPMSPNQLRYLEEVERLKNITISPGSYKNKHTMQTVTVLANENGQVKLLNHAGFELVKTEHWCKKNLVVAE